MAFTCPWPVPKRAIVACTTAHPSPLHLRAGSPRTMRPCCVSRSLSLCATPDLGLMHLASPGSGWRARGGTPMSIRLLRGAGVLAVMLLGLACGGGATDEGAAAPVDLMSHSPAAHIVCSNEDPCSKGFICLSH